MMSFGVINVNSKHIQYKSQYIYPVLLLTALNKYVPTRQALTYLKSLMGTVKTCAKSVQS